VQAESKDLES